MDGNGVSVVLCFTRLLILHLKKILLSKRVVYARFLLTHTMSIYMKYLPVEGFFEPAVQSVIDIATE